MPVTCVNVVELQGISDYVVVCITKPVILVKSRDFGGLNAAPS